MDKWEKISQIRQDRIDELKQDNKRLRERVRKQDELLESYYKLCERWNEMYQELKESR